MNEPPKIPKLCIRHFEMEKNVRGREISNRNGIFNIQNRKKLKIFIKKMISERFYWFWSILQKTHKTKPLFFFFSKMVLKISKQENGKKVGKKVKVCMW